MGKYGSEGISASRNGSAWVEPVVTRVFFYCYSHIQPGHEPNLVRVKMGRNSPGIDSNLHTVRVETARYGFCIRI